ncbi:MAG: NDP-hexose 4-ketoreductase, partial [Firmicutes bacterium]|nr:NDP-hexose 4-ketoreductase [Bacillota bacterium]
PLNEEQIRNIARLMVKELEQRLERQGLTMELEEDAYKFLAEEGFDSVYGARPLRRAILRMIEDPISESILSGEYREGDRILLRLEDGQLAFHKESPTEAAPAEESTADEESAPENE